MIDHKKSSTNYNLIMINKLNNIKCCDDYKSNFDYILHICKILTNAFVNELKIQWKTGEGVDNTIGYKKYSAGTKTSPTL